MLQPADESVFYFSFEELRLIIGLTERLNFSTISGILFLFVVYILIHWLVRTKFLFLAKTKLLFLTICVGFLSYPFAFYESDSEVVREGMVNSKTSYFIHKSSAYWFNKDTTNIEVHPIDFAQLNKDFYSNSTSENQLYPIFQKLPEESSLAPFFKSSAKKPNIVFVIVESLSSDFVGENALKTGNLMPFLDSLSTESIYFPNVFATAERTHNVLPATLCSLPNSVDGTVFQQIEYPNHWSLMSLLRKDYFSRFYCGVRMEFINMQGFMRYHKTNLMSEKWSVENRKDSAKINSSWGFPDECIYRQSEQDEYLIPKNKAQLDVFLTISSHDPFKYANQKKWIRKATKCLRKVKNKALRKALIANSDAMGAYMYTDASLKAFFEKWKQKPEFQNTIFVITGDHGTERCPINVLSPYKVPLLIYSPLLLKPKTSRALATHLDIPISLLNLLRTKYGQSLPDKIPYIGKELEFSSNYQRNRSLVFSSTQWRSDNCFSKGFALIDGQLYDCRKSLDPIKKKNAKELYYLKKQTELYQKFSRYVLIQKRVLPGAIHDRVFGTISWTLLKKWSAQIPKEKQEEKYVLLGKSPISASQTNIRIQVLAQVVLEKETDIDSLSEFGLTAIEHKKMQSKYFLFKGVKPIFIDRFKPNKSNRLRYTLEFSPKTFEKLKGKNEFTLYFYNRNGSKKVIESYEVQLFTGK